MLSTLENDLGEVEKSSRDFLSLNFITNSFGFCKDIQKQWPRPRANLDSKHVNLNKPKCNSFFLFLHTYIDRQPDDEKNLLYVAVSRAKKCLQLNGTILRLLACRMVNDVKSCVIR